MNLHKTKSKVYFYIFISGLTFMVLMFQSCVYDVETDLRDEDNCNPQAVSYSMEVVPILDTHCYTCHATSEASGGVILDTHDDAQDAGINGNLYCSINHSSTCSEMPQNAPQLLQCEIQHIKSWIDDGAPNN